MVKYNLKNFGIGEVIKYGELRYKVEFMVKEMKNRSLGNDEERKVVYEGLVMGVVM